MSVLTKCSIKVNTKFIFDPVVINSSVVALRDSARSRFHVELGRFTLSFQEGVRVASLPEFHPKISVCSNAPYWWSLNWKHIHT